MPRNGPWLAKLGAAFEQQILGEDGAAAGRQLRQDQDDAWRADRAASAPLAYEDALVETGAWNNC
ncbi:hypothetical protein [Duganella vulcania]|uniref:Uncharacterized protein n=1 Tax=Duganella vulcania TaxID=2692166 RepID=A0A845GDD5_9BURK|nr:hypothetical protein [Duganella vulcania]MYM92633.1 hypothetical protein [Duganella vulcania]